jgi:hypothetical protein
MQFTFAILAAFVSAAVAAPATKRQNSCPLQSALSFRCMATGQYTQPSFYSLDLGGLSVTASADSSGKTRWDVFTVSSGLIQQGDLAWVRSFLFVSFQFTIDSLNKNSSTMTNRTATKSSPPQSDPSRTCSPSSAKAPSQSVWMARPFSPATLPPP